MGDTTSETGGGSTFGPQSSTVEEFERGESEIIPVKEASEVVFLFSVSLFFSSADYPGRFVAQRFDQR